MNPVVVIGAGPYGLSAAVHLRARGVPVRIFGTPMASWLGNMPAGMVLKSTPQASTISAPKPGHTLPDFCDAVGIPRLETEEQLVPAEVFVRYGLWFQRQLVPDVEQAQVVAMDLRDGALHLELDSGERFPARAVVVATGLIGFAYLPPELAAAVPDGPSAAAAISHSSQHTDLTRFAGCEVVVVGAGQSALESAALLQEAGAIVTLLVRGRAIGFGDPPRPGPHWQPDSPMGRAWSLHLFTRYAAAFRHLPAATRLYLVDQVLGPCGAWWLRERVAGRVPVLAGRRITAARVADHRAVLTVRSRAGAESELAADHVIAATGYRVDLRALGYLGTGLRAAVARTGSSPRLDGSFQSAVPGLYFTGLPAAATFGPVLRFVCGTWFASPRLAAAVAATHG
jgi:FAD-dependent urate hydroxylase